jgi:hypothetical protein
MENSNLCCLFDLNTGVSHVSKQNLGVDFYYVMDESPDLASKFLDYEYSNLSNSKNENGNEVSDLLVSSLKKQ